MKVSHYLSLGSLSVYLIHLINSKNIDLFFKKYFLIFLMIGHIISKLD